MIVRIVLVVTMAAVLLSALPAGAQDDEDPPCPAGAAPSATIHASDLEDSGGPLTATHTIDLTLETSEGETVDEMELEVPPGVRKPERGFPRFQADSPGPVPVRARWQHFSEQTGSVCTATTEGTISVLPAKRPKYVPPRRRSRTTELDWFVRFGKNFDLRPVQVRVRAVRRARVPRPSARVRTVTYALRAGDKGVSLGGNSERVLRTPAGRFSVTFGHDDDLWVALRNLPHGRRPAFGVDLQLVQGGRRLGRTRLKGRCNSFYCSYRSVR